MSHATTRCSAPPWTRAATPSSTPRSHAEKAACARRCRGGKHGQRMRLPHLTSDAFDLTDGGVKGREAPGPLDGFLYTERGVYRPGEEVRLAAIRARRIGKPASLPVTVIVTRPDGINTVASRSPTQPASHSAHPPPWRPSCMPTLKVKRSRRVWSRTSCLSASTSSSSRLLTRRAASRSKAFGRYLYGSEEPRDRGRHRRENVSKCRCGGGLPRLQRPTRASSPVCASRSTSPPSPTRRATPTLP